MCVYVYNIWCMYFQAWIHHLHVQVCDDSHRSEASVNHLHQHMYVCTSRVCMHQHMYVCTSRVCMCIVCSVTSLNSSSACTGMCICANHTYTNIHTAYTHTQTGMRICANHTYTNMHVFLCKSLPFPRACQTKVIKIYHQLR